MKKLTVIIAATFLTINLALITFNSMESYRKIKIIQLENEITSLNNTIVANREDFETQVADINTYNRERLNESYDINTTIREERDIALQTVNELNRIIIAADMNTSVSSTDYELLYEYYFLTGIIYAEKINETAVQKITSKFANTRTWNSNTDIYRLKSFIIQESIPYGIFDIKLNTQRAPHNIPIQHDQLVYKINERFSYAAKYDYIAEYFAGYYEVTRRFEENEIPYTTNLIRNLINSTRVDDNFPGLTFGYPKDALARFLQRQEDFLDEQWSKSWPRDTELYK